MKNKKLRDKIKSFGFQMAFLYLTAGLVVIILFSGVVYTVTSDILMKEAVSKTQMAIESGAGGIGQHIKNAKNLLTIYAKDTTLIELAGSATGEKQQNVVEQMRAIRESDANIFQVFAVLSNGEVIGSSGSTPRGDFGNINTDTPCLSRERTNNYVHNDPWVVTIGVPIVNAGGKELGTLALDLDYCLFTHTVSGFDMGENGNISIENSKGELVFQTEEIAIAKGNISYEAYGQAGDGYDAKANLLIHNFEIQGTDWTMIGRASLDGLKVIKRQISDMVVFTGILLFLALLAITASVSKKLTTPLSRLAHSMEDIESLAELAVNTNEISETAILTDSYNRMIQRIKQLMQELEDKQGEIRKHEIDALTSQINPHFLYNTLDTIVWLAEFRDNDKIIALTKSLAAFFRLSLNGGREVVSLYDEIEHVKQYLFIQKERYGDKLSYSFAADEEALACMVPKIVLQPIVENAIYHGIKAMEGNGHIHIEAYAKGDDLLLCVSDNGVGFNEQKNGSQSDKENGGVGLGNVEKRIRLYYGKDASVKIKSDIGKGTKVTLNLKVQLKDYQNTNTIG